MIKKVFLILIISLTTLSCADYNSKRISNTKKYYTSSGFALIYEIDLYKNKIINTKISDDEIGVLHSFLKKNTHIQITNPINNKSIKTKVLKKANYPNFFNIVISKKVESLLDLDKENPFVEVVEIKKNKTFIAKESSIFDVEKNVAEKAPVEEIKMDNLMTPSTKDNKKKDKNEFLLIISDFYYPESAEGLKNELVKKTKNNNFFILKINNTKYRLMVGPFKNFNALKTTYISLNNLGFADLNVYRK